MVELLTEKFALRGTAIIGENKTALVQKITSDSPEDILILSIGDSLNDRRIVDIAQDFVTFDDGTKLYIDIKNF